MLTRLADGFYVNPETVRAVERSPKDTLAICYIRDDSRFTMELIIPIDRDSSSSEESQIVAFCSHIATRINDACIEIAGMK